MRRASGLLIALATSWALSGCASLEPEAKDDVPANVKAFEMSEGYALLYDLVSKEKQASLLGMIKKESPELKALLERISETSKATAKEMEALAKINPPVNLKVTHLPRMEQATRDSIDRDTSRELLRSDGVVLEFNMVSSQLSAMNYAAHLARSLAVVEANPQRKEFLQRTARKYAELYGQVHKMLLTRYIR
jgi:hypothetical protein